MSALTLLLPCTPAAASISLSIAFVLFDSSLFGWHPLFMSVGFLLFMTEGLIGAGTLWGTDREVWLASRSDSSTNMFRSISTAQQDTGRQPMPVGLGLECSIADTGTCEQR